MHNEIAGEIHAALEKLGASCYILIAENGEHNEASWQKENIVYLNYLWK